MVKFVLIPIDNRANRAEGVLPGRIENTDFSLLFLVEKKFKHLKWKKVAVASTRN